MECDHCWGLKPLQTWRNGGTVIGYLKSRWIWKLLSKDLRFQNIIPTISLNHMRCTFHVSHRSSGTIPFTSPTSRRFIFCIKNLHFNAGIQKKFSYYQWTVSSYKWILWSLRNIGEKESFLNEENCLLNSTPEKFLLSAQAKCAASMLMKDDLGAIQPGWCLISKTSVLKTAVFHSILTLSAAEDTGWGWTQPCPGCCPPALGHAGCSIQTGLQI